MPVESGKGCNPQQSSQQQYTLACSQPLEGRPQQVDLDLGRVILYHQQGDPVGVNRIRVHCGQIEAVVLPSKGFSIEQVVCAGKPIFWNPPLEILPEPADINPEAPLQVNGALLGGFAWIRGFTGGVEMLGPLNWGMPVRTPDESLLGLHGAAANIPVREVTVQVRREELWLSASFEVRDRKTFAAGEDKPWYEAGDSVYRITKNLIFNPEIPGFRLQDELTNLSTATQTPDWGYHVQLHPQPEAPYLVPSRSRHQRGGGAVEPGHEIWPPVKPGSPRVERGIVHRKAMWKTGLLDGGPGVPTLLRYADGRGIEVILPPVPYLLSWFSAGGAGSDEFMIPPSAADQGPRRILERDWNGVGPEIGASALDHDGDIDPAVPVQSLSPGESMSIKLQFSYLTAEAAGEREREIQSYNSAK
jgi:hypothetical protein